MWEVGCESLGLERHRVLRCVGWSVPAGQWMLGLYTLRAGLVLLREPCVAYGITRAGF